MQVWLYVFLGCTRACVCRRDGDVISVGHDRACQIVYPDARENHFDVPGNQ